MTKHAVLRDPGTYIESYNATSEVIDAINKIFTVPLIVAIAGGLALGGLGAYKQENVVWSQPF